MKKHIISVFVLLPIFFSACIFWGDRVEGNGNLTTETRDKENTSKIKALGSIDVVVKQGPASVQIEADDNLVQYIVTEMNDGWLEIHFKDNVNIHSSNPVKVTVTSPEFTDFRVTGSGSLTSADKIFSEHDMTLKTTGSGNLNVDVNAPKVHVEVTGSGNTEITGETKDVEVRVTGSGSYKGENLKAENVTIGVSGSGDATVFADVTLNARVTGSGSVRYAGKADVKMNITGGGEVRRMDQ